MIKLQKLTCTKCGNSTGFLVNEDTAFFDLFIIRDQEKNATLDKIHALNDCALSEINRLMQSKSMYDLIKAHELAKSLNMLIPKSLPQGVQEAMSSQRYELMSRISKLISKFMNSENRKIKDIKQITKIKKSKKKKKGKRKKK